MFWYDIHFIFSNKIFKKYEIDEISLYCNSYHTIVKCYNYKYASINNEINNESSLALFFKKKCRNFMVSSI